MIFAVRFFRFRQPENRICAIFVEKSPNLVKFQRITLFRQPENE